MIGQRFGRLVVLSAADNVGDHKRWRCQCDCGRTAIVWQLSLRRGQSQSCGCLKTELQKQRWAAYRPIAFWNRVDSRGPNQCWNWTGLAFKGPKNATPYGVLGFDGIKDRAHRVAWKLTHGPVPPHTMVLHHCDNTLCCNPDHLYLGNHADNMRDVRDRERHKGLHDGEKNARAKLTQEQAEEIRGIYAVGERSQQSIADEYGISQFAVSAIVRGKRYVSGST